MKKCMNFKLTSLIPVILIFLLSNHVLCLGAQSVLKGGVAKVNITPPIGTWLTGYGGRDRPCDGVEDELYARTLVLDDGQNTIAIVSTDLLWVSLEFTNRIREIVKEKIGIPEKNVFICATHTHWGPKIAETDIIGAKVPDNKPDKFYVQTLAKKVAGSVLIAYKNMQEAKIGAVKGEIPEIVYNRRTRRKDGSVKITWNLSEPDSLLPKIVKKRVEGLGTVTFTIPSENPELIFGPVDPEVCILRLEGINGEIIGSIINFACHPTAGTSSRAPTDAGYYVSGDFPAYAVSVVEEMEGGVCLFANGTAGNMACITRTKKRKDPRLQMGKALGGEALRRLQFVPTTNDITLTALKKDVDFPIKKTPSPNRNLELDKLEKDTRITKTEFQVLRVGDIYILGLPGEVLVEIGLEIKRRAGIENLFIVSLSSDVIGNYVCHSEAYEEGGYESDSGTNLAKGAGEIMIKEALDILNQIK